MSEEDLVIPPELFDPEFDEYHEALETLRDVLVDVGFHVYKKKDKDGTLQVYLERGVKYPLLNPRFVLVPEDEDSKEAEEGEPVIAGLAVSVISKGGVPDLDATLQALATSDDVWFQPAKASERRSDEYLFHGNFLIPVPFVPGVNPAEIDFIALAEPWRRIHFHLS